MRQFTTPTLPLEAEGVDITGADYVWVTFASKSRNHIITKDKESLILEYNGKDTLITVELTQQETGSFLINERVDIEINWMNGTKRGATEIKTINVKENLLNKVMPEGVEPNE